MQNCRVHLELGDTMQIIVENFERSLLCIAANVRGQAFHEISNGALMAKSTAFKHALTEVQECLLTGSRTNFIELPYPLAGTTASIALEPHEGRRHVALRLCAPDLVQSTTQSVVRRVIQG